MKKGNIRVIKEKKFTQFCSSRQKKTVRKKTGQKQSTGSMIAKIAFGVLFVIAGFSSPDSGWSWGYFFTALVIGAALIAWGLVPNLKEKKLTAAAKADAEAFERELANEPKVCKACGATSKGKCCEYCGTKFE